MGMYTNTFRMLGNSLRGNDFLILIAAIVTLFFMISSISMARAIKSRTKEWKEQKNIPFSRFLVRHLNKSYTMFTTMITIFPLLGMLGTVFGLLGLDLAAGDMENIKNNFFIALTSTAWGIIFSVIFKLINAFISDFLEEQIEIAKKLAEDIN